MRLRERLHLPMSGADAAVMYADGEYTAIRGRTLGATSAESSVDGDPSGAFTVRTTLVLPTDRVPDIVRPFVGSSVTVHEKQSWQGPEDDGGRRGTMTLEVAGTPAGLTAGLVLSSEGETATVDIDGDLVAKVPLLGSRLEKATLPYVSKVLRAEEKAASTYRAAHGS